MAHAPKAFGRYIEPFAGSGCLFFALRPRRAVLGDINEELIETYRVIRDHPRLVAQAAHSLSQSKSTYYRLRAQVPSKLNPIERAARFAYLNRHCFNGVYRINRNGQFNVPMGTRTGTLPTVEEFYRCSVALRTAELRPGSYAECLKDVTDGDFVYLDPPYASSRRNTFGEYGYGCFAENDLPDMQMLLHEVDERGATFLLSYCTHRAFQRIPKGWFKREVSVRRHVAGFARHRRTVRELLISNRAFTSTEI